MAIEKTATSPLVLSDGQGWSLVISPGDDVVLGRAADTVKPIPHIAAARRHARIRFSGSVCLVEDLKSTSGTYLNGYLVRKPEPIGPGDVLRIGPFEVTVSRA